MANKNSDYSYIKENDSKEKDTLDKKTYLYQSELFSGKTPDVRDIHKMMPEQRILKLKKRTDTDRSLNKFLEDTTDN